VIRIPSGSPIAVDGKVSANEWEDSEFVTLPVAKNWIVRVRFKHDTENLYFEFESVKPGSARLFRRDSARLEKSQTGDLGAGWVVASRIE
jgi:hypothetical protein